jgi:hypothetical protein
MGIRLDIEGLDKVRARLQRFERRALDQKLTQATRAGAVMLVPYIRDEAPVGRTGLLRRSVRAAATKREKPGAFVGPSKRAWYRHFVIGGTKRGVRGNPFVARGARRGHSAAVQAMRDALRELFQ